MQMLPMIVTALVIFSAILEITNKDDTKILILSCSCEINPQTAKLVESGGYNTASGKTHSSGSSVLALASRLLHTGAHQSAVPPSL